MVGVSYSGSPAASDGVERLVEARCPRRCSRSPCSSRRDQVQPAQPVAAERDDDVAGVRVDAEDPHAGLVREHRHATRCGRWRPAGPRPAAKSSAPSLCTISSRSPAGSTSYSTPCRRGATTRGSPSGSSVGSSRYSEVSLLPAADDQPLLVAAGVRRRARTARRARCRPRRRRPGRCPAGAAARRTGARPRRRGCRRGGRCPPRPPRRPCRGSVVAQLLAGPEVLDPQGEALVAGDVDGVGQQLPVGGDR